LGALLISRGGPFDGTHPVHGIAAVDTFAVNLGRFDNGRLNLHGRLIVAGSLRGTLVYTDIGNVDHPMELHFNK